MKVAIEVEQEERQKKRLFRF